MIRRDGEEPNAPPFALWRVGCALRVLKFVRRRPVWEGENPPKVCFSSQHPSAHRLASGIAGLRAQSAKSRSARRPANATSSLDVGHPRAGQSGNMDHPGDEGVYLNTAVWALAGVSSVFLALRVYSKFRSRRRLWWDDMLIIVAWVRLPPGGRG